MLVFEKSNYKYCKQFWGFVSHFAIVSNVTIVGNIFIVSYLIIARILLGSVVNYVFLKININKQICNSCVSLFREIKAENV